MPATGTIKFFERSRLLASDGATAQEIPDTNASVRNVLSFDRDGYYRVPWSSSLAQRSVFFFKDNEPISVNRFFLLDSNITRLSLIFFRPAGGGRSRPATLDNISDIDNNTIVQTGQGLDIDSSSGNYYLEFDEIPLTGFLILISPASNINLGSTTQSFYIRQAILTKEIGSMIGSPNISGYNENYNEIINQTSTGLKHITKQHNTIDSFTIKFKQHPIGEDVQLVDRLFNSQESFTLWPCGGGYGSNHFLYAKDGWNLDDVFNVQTVGNKSNRWHKNFYKGGVSSSIKMVESL